MDVLDRFGGPALKALVDMQLRAWPEHFSLLKRSFSGLDMEDATDAEELAKLILALIETDEETPFSDYRWMCRTMVEEELFFRRTEKYRHETFAAVDAELYSKPELMTRHLNGLLLSQVFWSNHRKTIGYYRRAFLASLEDGYRHFEVGPGHGLYLYFAANDPRCRAATAWDVSPAGADMTTRCLDRLGAGDRARVLCRDAQESGDADGAFDSIVISEVLEHLEDPVVHLHQIVLCDALLLN